MSATTFNENELLEHIFEKLDISKTDYDRAVKRYNTLGAYLKEKLDATVYTQGSFAYGTVVRPYSKGTECEYDIDIVCQYEQNDNSPQKCKQTCGNVLKQNENYSNLLKKEGRRCWTLEYAEQNKVGFHIDVLPCKQATSERIQEFVELGVTDQIASTAIMITNKLPDGNYSKEWGNSNPHGYKAWLDTVTSPYKVEISKRLESTSVEPVPDYYTNKTTVHKVIQLLKRHRDVRFDGTSDEDNKPISMIITTFVARIAETNQNKNVSAFELLEKVINSANQILDSNEQLDNDISIENFVTKKNNGQWSIPNPVDPKENFADKWHENGNAKAKAFFKWVKWLENDLLVPLKSRNTVKAFKTLQTGLGEKIIKDIYIDKNLTATAQTINIQQKSELTTQPKPWRTK